MRGPWTVGRCGTDNACLDPRHDLARARPADGADGRKLWGKGDVPPSDLFRLFEPPVSYAWSYAHYLQARWSFDGEVKFRFLFLVLRLLPDYLPSPALHE